MSLTTDVMAIFVIFWPILAKIWLPCQRLLDPCNQKCLLWIGRPRKPAVISNHILAISHRNAFMAILVPKLVAMVTPLCPLCTGVSKIISRWHKPYLQTKLCMDMSLASEVMTICVIIHAGFGFEIGFVPSVNSSLTLPYTRDKGALQWQPILGLKLL